MKPIDPDNSEQRRAKLTRLNQDSHDELRERLADILEPHYWNQGMKDGKAAAHKSVTMTNLVKLINAHTNKAIEKALHDDRLHRTKES